MNYRYFSLRILIYFETTTTMQQQQQVEDEKNLTNQVKRRCHRLFRETSFFCQDDGNIF